MYTTPDTDPRFHVMALAFGSVSLMGSIMWLGAHLKMVNDVLQCVVLLVALYTAYLSATRARHLVGLSHGPVRPSMAYRLKRALRGAIMEWIDSGRPGTERQV